MKRIICWLTNHKFEIKKRFHSEDGISGISQYKIVCSRCGLGNKKEWRDEKVFIIKQ